VSTLEESIVSQLNMNAKQVNLDGVPQWGDPSVQGQISNEASWDLKGAYVKVLDLSDSKDLKFYEDLLSATMAQDPVKVIIDQERKFSEQTNNWLVYVNYVEIVYKKLTGTNKA